MKSIKEITEEATGETKEALEGFVSCFAKTIEENRLQKQKIDYLSQDIRLLKKKLFGASSEKHVGEDAALQPEIFDELELCRQEISKEEEESLSEEDSNDTEDLEASNKKKKGRKPLPKHLARRIEEHDLSNENKQCGCGAKMDCMGETTSEELEYKPAELIVVEHRCKKYTCTVCSQANKNNPEIKPSFKIASKPLKLIPKSISTPSLIAQIIIQKFCDHLPLYRQETIFNRYGIDLSRQVMSQWVIKVAKEIVPLINLMQEKILDYNVSFADETTLQVLHEPGKRAQTKSYMWCFIGGPPDKRVIIYQYHSGRSANIPENFFEGYQGALHCDGYVGYLKLIQSKKITGVNCMAHVRRKFIEALPGGKEKGISGHVVRKIRKLYAIESQLKKNRADTGTIYKLREQLAKPILEELKIYLDEKQKVVPPKSKIGQAIQYTLKRWPYLVTYLEDGRYEIDNNRAERAIKPFVIGRKNWLFSNATSGAHASARLFSLIETAKANDLDLLSYIMQIIKELPHCKCLEDYEALLPWNIRRSQDSTEKAS